MRKPVVYFVQQNNGPVKIGYANDLAARVLALQGANPYPLRTRAVIPAIRRSLEGYIHQMFCESRLEGEWFDMRHDPDLESFVASSFKLLTKHIAPALPDAAAAMSEHLYIPKRWLSDVQDAMDGFADDLIASMPEPNVRRSAIPREHIAGHDSCVCGNRKLRRSKRCAQCYVAEQKLHGSPSWHTWRA